MFGVGRVGQQLQVLWTVVRLVAISVMHNFAALKLAPKKALNN